MRASLALSVTSLIRSSGAVRSSFGCVVLCRSCFLILRYANFPSGQPSVCSALEHAYSCTVLQAMASAGIIPGLITCAFSGAICGFGLYLLTRCARATPHRRSSFFAVSQLTFPQAAVFFDAAIAIKCFGVSVRCVLT